MNTKKLPLKALLVEDEPLTCQVLRKMMEAWGYEVFTAEHGGEAWEIFRKENIKIVVADWLMPVMDGLTLCRKIRSSECPGYVYIIVVTGKNRKEDIIEGLAAGADDYLTKPFDPQELKLRLRAGERILSLERELTEEHEKLRELNIRLEELARIDSLMNIGNRRGFHETIEKIHHRACRYDRRYGIIMCDIDNFKSYNDTYGHIHGDGVLRTVAESIKRTIRLSDDVFRYGGEEIVVVLPEQNLASTALAAERIRRDIETIGIEHRGSEFGVVTVSCGVTAFEDDCDTARWEPVLDRADKAMYLAKNAGRNRVATLPS
jgi:two-component system chemotaxis response regulator CheY